ncbi:MAG: glutamine--fructose-6-phosphate transaminase (isomerizing), partial [Deltaproteobacteria bacterium]|nr:glutamine--fructose-6-phosphate transaminase (isomerizing) [Deltaproteobacteria bacterium]
MCGIVGYLGKTGATEILLDGLSRLEYRGYDSAGISILAEDGSFHRRRVRGKLRGLKELLKKEPLPPSSLGIAHTRWATHGGPSESNAHPHQYQGISIVHNGILENHAELKAKLEKLGHVFSSETDSEVFAHLFFESLQKEKDSLRALQKSLEQVRGSYAVVLINQQEDNSLYAARKGSPLVLGHGEGEFWLASDVPALLPYTREVSFLEEGTLLKITRQGFEAFDLELKPLKLKNKTITWSLAMAEKGGYKHFMLKEIFEQPRALSDTLSGRLLGNPLRLTCPELEEISDLDFIEKVHLIACGTSYHAALTGRYFLEAWTGLFTQVENASEFRYREVALDDKTLVITLSQSGETADTLEALRLARSKGAKTLAITN